MICLAKDNWEKKKKYLKHYLNCCQFFILFVFLVGRLISIKTVATMKFLSRLKATKWVQEYLSMFIYVHTWLRLSLVQANSRCLHAEQLTIWLFHQLQFEKGIVGSTTSLTDCPALLLILMPTCPTLSQSNHACPALLRYFCVIVG